MEIRLDKALEKETGKSLREFLRSERGYVYKNPYDLNHGGFRKGK